MVGFLGWAGLRGRDRDSFFFGILDATGCIFHHPNEGGK